MPAPARPIQPVYVRPNPDQDPRAKIQQSVSIRANRAPGEQANAPSRGLQNDIWDRATLEAELLRLETQNLSLLHALDREEHCRDEIEQLFWHDDQAGIVANPETFINSKMAVLIDKNTKLEYDLDRAMINLEKARKHIKDGDKETAKSSIDILEENAELASARNQVEKEFREWREHESALRAQSLSTMKRLEKRCTDLQKQVINRGALETDRSNRRPGVSSIDDLQSFVAHAHTVQVQMQDRIERLTSLLMEERQARRKAQESARSVQRSLEDVAAQTSLNARDGHLETYMANLHQQLNAFQDAIVLLKNENDELIHRRGQMQTEQRMAMDRAMREMKDQEQRFLTEMRAKQLEIESIQRERVEASPSDSDESVQNLKERLREREESVVMLQSRLEATGQVSQQWISRLPTAQRAVQEMEQKVIVLGNNLDSERKRVLQLENELHELQMSRSGSRSARSSAPDTEARETKSRIRELEDMVEALKAGMTHVEHDLEEQQVSTQHLQDKHKRAIKELEMELELLRSRTSKHPPPEAAPNQEDAAGLRDSTLRFVAGRSNQLEARLALLEGDKRELRARVAELEEEVQRLELALGEAAREVARGEQEAMQGREERSGALEAEAAARVAALEERVRDADEKRDRRAAEAGRLKEEVVALMRRQRTLEASLEEERASTKGYAAVSDMLREAEVREEELERRLQESSQDLVDGKRAVSNTMALLRHSEASLEEAQAQKRGLEAAVFEMRAELKQAKDAATKASQKNRLLERSKAELESEVADLGMRVLTNEREGNAEARREVMESKDAVARLQAEQKSREEELEETITRKLDAEAANVKAAEHVVRVEKTVKELAMKLREAQGQHDRDAFEWKSAEQALQHRIMGLEEDRERKAKLHSSQAAELEALRAQNRGLEFEHGVANAELQQTGERLSHTISNTSTLQLSIRQLEMSLHEKNQEGDDLRSQLEEAHALINQLQDRIEEDRLRAGGTSNIAWSKLQEVSGRQVEAHWRVSELEKQLREAEAAKKMAITDFKNAEQTWAHTTRELEAQVEELKSARKSVAEELRTSKRARTEDSDLVKVLQAELEAAQARDRELKEHLHEQGASLAEAKKLVVQLQAELEEAGRQIENRELKTDQLLLDCEAVRNDLKKAEDSLQAMGDVAHNQQAHITLLQAEKEMDVERVKDLADEELFLAKEQIASLKQELEYIQDQVRVAINTRSKEQEQALLTARIAQEQFDELREQTEGKKMAAMQQVDDAKEQRKRAEGVAAELEGLLAEEREKHHQALELLVGFKARHDGVLQLHARVRTLAVDRLLATHLSRALAQWRACVQHRRSVVGAALVRWRPDLRAKEAAVREWRSSVAVLRRRAGQEQKVAWRARRRRLWRALAHWRWSLREMSRRWHAGGVLLRWNGGAVLGRVFRAWVWARTLRARMGLVVSRLHTAVERRAKTLIFRAIRRHCVRARCVRRFVTHGRMRARRGLLGRAMDAFERQMVARWVLDAAATMSGKGSRSDTEAEAALRGAQREAAERAAAATRRKQAVEEEQERVEEELRERREALEKTQDLAEEAARTLQAMMTENHSQRMDLEQMAEEKESIAAEAALYREQAAGSLLEKEVLEREAAEVREELTARQEALTQLKRQSDERMENIEEHKVELARTESLAAEAARTLKEMIDKNESLESELELMGEKAAATEKEKEDLVQAAWARELGQGREVARLQGDVKSLEEELKATRERETRGAGGGEELRERLASAEAEVRRSHVMLQRAALHEWRRCRAFAVRGARGAGRMLEKRDRELAAQAVAALGAAVKGTQQRAEYAKAWKEMAREMDAVKGGALDLATDLDEAVEEVRVLRESKAFAESQIEELQREVGVLEDELSHERKNPKGEEDASRWQARVAMLEEELQAAMSERDAALAALETLRAQVLGMHTSQ